MNLKETLESMFNEHHRCKNISVLGYDACTNTPSCVKCDEISLSKLLEMLEREYVPKEEPDSLEKIEADARKDGYVYWNCRDIIRCSDCPAMINGKNPKEYYKAAYCREAQTIDLLRRQRELLEGEQCKN